MPITPRRSDSAEPGRFSPRLRHVVVVLLGVLAVQAVGSMRLLTATSDETSHLPSGYTYLVTGEIRLNPQHPPFVKLLSALPLLALGPTLDLDDPAWTAEPPDEWQFGANFLYSNDADRLLFWGRIPVVLLSLLLGWFVYRWASEMFGPPAGVTALFLYVFSPTVVAHSRFVTMDLAVTCFSTLFLYYLWRTTRSPGRTDTVLAGACLGLALASKFSALILVPVLGLLMVATAAGTGDRRAWHRPFLRGGAVVAIAVVVVYAVYLFPSDPSFYLDGIKQVNRDHDPDRAYYMLGQFRVGGWPSYFLVAFLVKTPVITLGLLGLAVVLWSRNRAPRLLDEAYLVIPAVSWFVVTSVLADDLGVRYLLPVYPLLFVFVSRLAGAFDASRFRLAVAGGLALAYVVSAVVTFPDHLAFFNVAVGGPARGYRYLSDSNLDWGQDLKRLSSWLDEHGVERVRLLYPWNGRPEYYGIRYDRMAPGDWYRNPSPGTYAVATVWLIRGLHEARTRDVPTDWLERYDPVGRVGYSFLVYRFDDSGGGDDLP